MANHELEITITKNGEVKVHVKGAKGKQCLEYSQWLTRIVGKIKDQQYTSEYYEPETKVRIELHQEIKEEG